MSKLTTRFREKPNRTPPRVWKRIEMIKRRAKFLNADFVGNDPASMAGAPTTQELADQRISGAQSGASWVARARGI